MILFLILFITFFSTFTSGQDDCRPASCHVSGPIVRFPFRLKSLHPDHCGYPGFDLTCGPNNSTILDFQYPVRASAQNIILPITAKATVQSIDYKTQTIRVGLLNGSCLPNRVPTVNSYSPPSPFELYVGSSSGFTLFNCSSRPETRFAQNPIDCLDRGPYRVYPFGSYYTVAELALPGCVKMYNTSYVSEVIFSGPIEYGSDDGPMHWPSPVCGGCEEKGMYCRLRDRARSNETECFQKTKLPEKGGLSKNTVTALIVVSVLVGSLSLIALYRVYLVKKRKRYNETRIQRFLEDYRALRPTRYNYSDVKKITDNFKHKLGQGGYGTVFKGKLSNEILVAVKVLNTVKGNGEDFLNEVSTIGKIHHINVVRLVGYCADGYNRALVYEFLENDSLEKYISSRYHRQKLSFEKLLEVSIKVAEGLDYLHQGCNQRILHFDIKPQNILLDANLNPKVADFGLAKLCSKDKSVVTMTAARGTIGYIAPEVFSRNFGKVSYKSDIYSFGMLLLDIVGGRKNYQADQDNEEVYFPEWMYNQLDKGEDLAIQIVKDDESEIVKRIIIVGLWCIQWYPADRPSMKVAIGMLGGEKMPVMPPNPFAASTPDPGGRSSGSIFSSEISSAQTSKKDD